MPAPVTDSDFYDDGNPDPALVELGKNLFFDKILSGNLNISCGTCHHVLTDTGDGLSLPVGEGGRGLGVTRDTGSGLDAIHERVPRNAQPIFNLGRKDFNFSFHDGRVEICPSEPSGFCSPAGDDLPLGLANILAAQAMFPVTSPAEMAGQESGENDQADAADPNDPDLPLVWDVIAQKLRNVGRLPAPVPGSLPGWPDAVIIRMTSLTCTPPMPSPRSRLLPGASTTVRSIAICAARRLP